ncbi:MAG: peptide chain release factor N(5)-glutamine methyltransferase [Oscillospiraceae bacterium]|nr:peptide chain release factor N(5)-glutamine methyltransferase [Oscillospiraceae bacterium]
MTIGENLKKGVEKLRQSEILDPVIKGRVILAFVIGESKEYLVINQDKELSQDEIEKFEEAINRLVKGEPLQHITGKQEFMGMDFVVNKDVLIPRPDTEILVEEVVEILSSMQNGTSIDDLTVLDLCTGSGAIAISIVNSVSNIKVLATDVSEEALKVARINEINNYMDISRIEFASSDLFEDIFEEFDLIVSNPPYIAKGEIEKLDVEVKREPMLALEAGVDGLDFYRKIISEAYAYLRPNGYLCLEIGYNQRDDVIRVINESEKYTDIYSKKDLAGNDRIVVCRRK